jgi:transposase
MCVAFDYAKATHTAMICNGEGLQLRGAFNVHNTPAGLAYVQKIIHGLCRKHAIARDHVICGGEDCGAYASNFIHALAAQGLLVLGVNAKDAKDERGNMLASTDKIDLLGVAGLLIKKRGRTIPAQISHVEQLRRLIRQRCSLVKSRSASMNRMHALVDQLLPGFLDAAQSGISPFSRASLWLMSERFSPRGIHGRAMPALVQRLRAFAVHDAEGSARQLKSLCEAVLPPPSALLESLQTCLRHEVGVYRMFSDSIRALEVQTARQLAATPGALLTTMPGMGPGLAAGLYAEMADPSRRQPLFRMASYAGLVNRLKQSGGPDKEPSARGRPRRANMFLKNLLLELVLHIGQHGDGELKADYLRRTEAGQYARLTMARKLLRICSHLLDGDFYVPATLRQHPSPEALAQYYQTAWPRIRLRWRDAGAIRQAFAKEAPLEQWRGMLNERYGLNLANSSPQAAGPQNEQGI